MILLPLVIDNWVTEDVIQIQRNFCVRHTGMLRAENPADVREEESSTSIVRVGVRFAVPVMNAVDATPFHQIALVYLI